MSAAADDDAALSTGPEPIARPRQLPGMARLMELTPELYAHYADPTDADPTDDQGDPDART